jgi:hypothetical protein
MWLEGLGASLAINSYRTLKYLELSIIVIGGDYDPLCGLCPELRLIAGNNVLEELGLDLEVQIFTSFRTESEDWSTFDSVLTESGAFPVLHRVTVEVRWLSSHRNRIEVDAVLESFKKDSFPRLRENEAVELSFSAKRGDW